MKKSIGFICIIISVFLLNSCENEDFYTIKNNHSYTIKSEYTNTKYDVNIFYPESYEPSNSYHTIYVLDGDDYFKEIVDVVEESGREDIFIIGIGYTGKNKRGVDYSYPKDIDFPDESGGAKEFINFINHELIPFVDDELGIQSIDRSLFGHSLGGYFALYILFQQEQPNPFNNIIAASPNFMWYDSYVFDLEHQYFDSYDTLNKNLYITVGDLEGASLNLYYNAFKNKIKSRSYNNLLFNGDRLENTSHRNSPIITFRNSLDIIF